MSIYCKNKLQSTESSQIASSPIKLQVLWTMWTITKQWLSSPDGCIASTISYWSQQALNTLHIQNNHKNIQHAIPTSNLQPINKSKKESRVTFSTKPIKNNVQTSLKKHKKKKINKRIPAIVTGESSSLALTRSLPTKSKPSWTLRQRAHAKWTTRTAISNSFEYSPFSIAKSPRVFHKTQMLKQRFLKNPTKLEAVHYKDWRRWGVSMMIHRFCSWMACNGNSYGWG